MSVVVGIDPGFGGALAFLPCSGEPEIIDMPTLELVRNRRIKRVIDAHVLADILQSRAPLHAFVEQVASMPGQGASSVFAFGQGYGTILGILAALEIAHTLIPPQRWKKAMRVPAAKDAARARASQIMPEAAHYWRLVKHDGRAEAALIAFYGANQTEFRWSEEDGPIQIESTTSRRRQPMEPSK